MSADSKLFIRDGISPLFFEKYLKANFQKVEKVDSVFEDTFYWVIENEQITRTVWMFIVTDDEDCPTEIVKGKSCIISVKYRDDSVNFLKEIGKQFKNSWILENDCDESKSWECLNSEEYEDSSFKEVTEKLAEFMDFVNNSKTKVTGIKLEKLNELQEDLSKHFLSIIKI